MDLEIAIPGLIVPSPFFLLTAIVIKCDSKGPAFFKHKRVGLNGKIFDMYKFRSMYVDVTDAVHKAHIDAYAHGKLDEQMGVKLMNDSRITRIGHFLRTTSIDELPQLINVIKGDMSLVGPRPVPIYEADYYNLWQSERLGTPPGMTGLWQVSGRSSVSFEEMIRLDIRYIRNQSLWLNILIIVKTIPAALSKKGAA
jgi:lipopolysaccharide/colanic/teichoic acid biosynthesis glycosyltransferase